MVISIESLDNPQTFVDPRILFKRMPFYNDFYVVMHLKPTFVPNFNIVPVIIDDLKLAKHYFARNLQKAIVQVIYEQERIYSINNRIKYSLFQISNGWWCFYLEKQHRWDYFVSTGVMTIFCFHREILDDFIEKFLAGKS